METVGDVRLRSSANARPRPCSASYIAVRAALYQLTRLSDFKTERIGGGFYANVFKVTHKCTGEVMVLKMNKYSKFSRQMLTEIQLMNRLSHPNILRFKGSCVHEGQLHALTEYINGGSLEDLLHNRSISLSWSVRVKIALDIATGMAYLHSRGVFHRDLSSRNCLIQVLADGSMKCVVADFGLAAKIKQSRRRSHTEVVGSPYWMAPECLNGKEYCEQADVFSYSIVLAETMTRLPADPDFMPRTKLYGMDFEVLHKMCPDCPEDLWKLMVQCCQIDPDERPLFEEAVKILEQTTVPEEEEEERLGNGGREADDLRACFSEPLLRIHDSDDTLSYTSGQSSTHQLLPINSTDSLDSYSANSLNCSMGQQQLEDKIITVPTPPPPQEETDYDLRTDDVFKDELLSTDTKHKPQLSILTSVPLADGTTSITIMESDVNKGDSGIDPGEFFVVANQQSSLSTTCSESKTTPNETQQERKRRNGAEIELTLGDITPPCPTPSRLSTNNVVLHTERERADPTSTVTASVSMFRSPSNDMVSPTTPCDRCCSPLAPSCASDVSLFLPNPSTPWAPPPSPLRSNSYRLSSSLPSSPSQKRRQFRFSMEIQEALFPPFDPSTFSSPSDFERDVVTLRSTPKSGQDDDVSGQMASKYKRRSLRHSCGHNTPLPTFPEDSDTGDQCFYDTFAWMKGSRDGSLCVNLDRERFTSLHNNSSQFQRSLSPLRRCRSASTPNPPPPSFKPQHYALNLTRYLPPSSTDLQHTTNNSTPSSSSTTASFFKYYTIRPCLNCRLSSSEPNLTTIHISTHTQLL